MISKIPVFIFSFNRGKFLRNAVFSVLQNFPSSSLTIIDDHSDDPTTLRILDELRRVVRVYIAPRRDYTATTGGLHANMNTAIKLAEEAAATSVLFLQDDQQIVRKVSNEEIEEMLGFFSIKEASFVLSVSFLKKGGGHHAEMFEPFGHFLRRPAMVKQRLPNRLISYSDTGIFNIPRLRATVGSLAENEPLNEMRSNELGLVLGFAPWPFLHCLPFPTSYKRRKRGLVAHVADFLSGAGVHPISIMTEAESNRLKSRDVSKPAFAEDWLFAPTAPKSEVWSLTGGVSNLVARGGWRRRFGNILIRIAK
ncbi:glycosyltransferase family 2 protein [Ovoidimarina sediminis]|uniref:glycosyltransferase family 2 protein n=1 Tax=Ovoidimarina sediminis TaxID=3079856 RepID=UPI002912B22F|nr:glycosyltransferase family A protein [Rhodophyticola sp. MJ-SS7]MDU8946151.1 glycosyltransferase family A protein [Rhodophyticola sp. MJ-SS7]